MSKCRICGKNHCNTHHQRRHTRRSKRGKVFEAGRKIAIKLKDGSKFLFNPKTRWATLDFGKESGRVKMVQSKTFVGSWVKSKPKVLIDKDLRKQDIPHVVAHELAEKRLEGKLGLPYTNKSNTGAHNIANIYERDMAKKQKLSWRGHQIHRAHIYKTKNKKGRFVA